MLETSIIEGTSVVSLTVDGSISADEETAAQQTIDQVVNEHGSARILLDYGGVDLGRVEPKAAWEDLKGTRLLDDIDRIGVVADSGVIDKFVDVIGSVSGFEARTFENRDEAVAWLTS